MHMSEISIKHKIKVVIWDLDDTLWQGILAEGDSVKPIINRMDIVRTLNRRGIISSICSKNNYDQAKAVLEKIGIWSEFVFPRINFNAKGPQIATLLKTISLRAENALFIDDSDLNLQEVQYYNSGINVLNANQCDNLLEEPFLQGKDDLELSRLMQYKMLEEKELHKDEFSSNESFLRESNICVEFVDYTDSLFDRTYELVERTNQLNFTKNRMSRDELRKFLSRPGVVTKLIHAVDNFCDYGLIGFYSIYEGRLVHFTFSCRTINMGIEQFVYEYLGYPEIKLQGDTASTLSKEGVKIDYIKVIDASANIYHEDVVEHILTEASKVKVFGLGACDLFRPMGFFDMPNQEFFYECNTFVGDERGVNVGTEYIRSQFDMTNEEKTYCRNYFRNYQRDNVFDSQIFSQRWDYVIMSFHDDMVFKIYTHRKNSNIRVLRSPAPMFGNTSIRALDKGIATSIGESKKENEEWFNREFEEGKYITPERFLDNLLYIAWHLPETTKIILVTGPEMDYYRERHLHVPEVRAQIIALNKVIRLLAKTNPDRFAMVDINECVRTREDVTDYVFHLTADAGYKLFQLIVKTIVSLYSSKKFPMLGRVLKNRKIVVISTDKVALDNAMLNLLLGNSKKTILVHYDKRNMNLEDFSKQIWHEFAHNKGEYYVVVAGQNDYPEIRNLLTSTGYMPLEDFTWLIKTKSDLIKWRDDSDEVVESKVRFWGTEHMKLEAVKCVYRTNIKLNPRDHDYNFYRYNLKANKKYCVVLKGIKSSSLEYTAGLFDFKINKQIYFDQFYAGKTLHFNFEVGNNENVAFLVYAGVVSRTRGNSISVDSFEVYEI